MASQRRIAVRKRTLHRNILRHGYGAPPCAVLGYASFRLQRQRGQNIDLMERKLLILDLDEAGKVLRLQTET